MLLTVAQIDAAYEAVLQRAPTDAEVIAAQSLDATMGYNGAMAAIVDFPWAQQNVYPIIQIIALATGVLPPRGNWPAGSRQWKAAARRVNPDTANSTAS
jgi:hypothetical protein